MINAGKSSNSARARVLVVEDDQLVRKVIVLQLSELPIDIVEAHNAAAALDACSVNLPTLVLLDMGLPDMNGAELCAEIRRRYPGIPVGIVSGATGIVERQQAADAGCSAYLVKPFASRELKMLVTQLLAVSTT